VPKKHPLYPPSSTTPPTRSLLMANFIFPDPPSTVSESDFAYDAEKEERIIPSLWSAAEEQLAGAFPSPLGRKVGETAEVGERKGLIRLPDKGGAA